MKRKKDPAKEIARAANLLNTYGLINLIELHASVARGMDAAKDLSTKTLLRDVGKRLRAYYTALY